MYFKYFIFIIFLLISSQGLCQLTQPNRYEISLTHRDSEFEVIPADDKGLFLYRRVIARKSEKIQLIKLDTALSETWSGYIDIKKNYFTVAKAFANGKLYLLNRYRDFTRNDLILYVVDDQQGDYMEYTVKGFIPFVPTEFEVTETAILAGGSYNNIPVVLYFSLLTNKSRVLPGLFSEKGELNQIQVNKDGSFDVLISGIHLNRHRTIFVRNYDADGNLIANFPVMADKDYHLIFGRLIKTPDGTQLIAGVFGTKSTEYTRGIFVASVDPSGLVQTRYYNYSDLKNFFRYMTARRETRVKNRIERRKVKGRKIRMHYRFLVHEIVADSNQFILLGEAFYPKYSYIDRSFSFFPRPTNGIVQDGRIFEGYQYTHAVVMGLKPNGDLIWDNSFEINDAKSLQLEQFVKLKIHDGKILLLYVFNNRIRSKILQGSEVLEGKTEQPLLTGVFGDVPRSNLKEINRLDYGPNNSFYAYGVQEIEGTNGRYRRRVFYVNKIKHLLR